MRLSWHRMSSWSPVGIWVFEIGDAEVPGVQKRLISESRTQNTVVITATQMMQSMVTKPQPTRAEVSDVSNAVLDGTDAVMLSAESAIGRHPVKVVAALDRICLAAERHRSVLTSGHRMESRFDSVEETIAMATMYTANHYNVVGIWTLTESGTTAKWMSRISSGIQIFGMTRNADTERRMALYRGVYPVPYDATQLPRGDVNRAVVAELESRRLVAEGDWLIITKGDFSGVKGGTNSIENRQGGRGRWRARLKLSSAPKPTKVICPQELLHADKQQDPGAGLDDLTCKYQERISHAYDFNAPDARP